MPVALEHLNRISSRQTPKQSSASQTANFRVASPGSSWISRLIPAHHCCEPIPEEYDPEEERHVVDTDPDQCVLTVPLVDRLPFVPEWIGQHQCRKVDSSRDHRNPCGGMLKGVLDVIHCTVPSRRGAIFVRFVNVACQNQGQLPERQKPSPVLHKDTHKIRDPRSLHMVTPIWFRCSGQKKRPYRTSSGVANPNIGLCGMKSVNPTNVTDRRSFPIRCGS